MYCTVISILIAAFLVINPIRVEGFPDVHFLGLPIILLSFAFIFVQLIIRALAWSPLQKSELDSTPHIMEMYHKDSLLKYSNLWIRIFPLISLLIACDLMITGIVPKNYLVALWIVTFGITLDAFNLYLNRVTSYLNPFAVVPMFTTAAKQSIAEEREADLLSWIDGLSEISLKALQNNNTSLCNQAIDETQYIAKSFLEASKSISHTDQDKDTKALGITDKVSYILFYLFQRLELINERAVEKRQDNLSGNIVAILGKIALYAAKYDITLTTYPIHFIGKTTKKAQQNHLQDVPLKASFVLVEIAKGIVNETDITYMDLQEPFASIIGHIDTIAKESFKQDKTVEISILTQPFKELRSLFKNEKFAQHRDAPIIEQQLNRVISEWDAVEIVLKTMPPMPKILPEGEKPFKSEPFAAPKPPVVTPKQQPIETPKENAAEIEETVKKIEEEIKDIEKDIQN